MNALGHRKEVEPFIAERFSQAIPILHSVVGANMGENAFGGAEIYARLSISADRRLVGFEVGLIRGAINILYD